jgi:peptide/nickel transport system permease protein
MSEWNWGTILFWAQGQQALAQGAWWWFVPAGLAIALLGTALSLVNFGIDEFVSPRLRSAGTTRARTADGRTVRMRVGFTPVLGPPNPGPGQQAARHPGLSQPGPRQPSVRHPDPSQPSAPPSAPTASVTLSDPEGNGAGR